MSSSAYDPSKFEFVARMGRIPRKDTTKWRKEKIPPIFRIPEPPEQEVVNVTLGRSMRAESSEGSTDHTMANLNEFLTDLPHRECTETISEEQKAFQQAQLEKMVEARQRRKQERDLEFQAQQLVNQVMLEKEIKELRRRDKVLKDIKEKITQSPRRSDMIGVNMLPDDIDPKLAGYIRKELERLIPIVKD